MNALILPQQKKLVEPSNTVEYISLKEKVHALILRDLSRLGWSTNYPNSKKNLIEVVPPDNYDQDTIRKSMGVKRQEIIGKNQEWINKHVLIARNNLTNGADVLCSTIKPVIEVCETNKQHELFRIFRYYWSSPYSEYVGRRIKLIIRDEGLPNKPVIGIAALGSPIIHIPARDNWIGWDRNTRTKNLNYTMDAYVVGALPPYNYLLGGKLISYILASKEVRKVFEKKYANTKYDKLAGIFTTSLYGKSAQYNRIKFNNKLLYEPIGSTKGFGTLHLTNETFDAMHEYLKENNIIVSNKFGAGPSWKMRVIHTAGNLLGFNPDFLLRHSFKRGIYYVSLAQNSVAFLNGNTTNLKNYHNSVKTLTSYWRKRWLKQRLTHKDIVEEIKNFKVEDFYITQP